MTPNPKTTDELIKLLSAEIKNTEWQIKGSGAHAADDLRKTLLIMKGVSHLLHSTGQDTDREREKMRKAFEAARKTKTYKEMTLDEQVAGATGAESFFPKYYTFEDYLKSKTEEQK